MRRDETNEEILTERKGKQYRALPFRTMATPECEYLLIMYRENASRWWSSLGLWRKGMGWELQANRMAREKAYAEAWLSDETAKPGGVTGSAETVIQ